jgi:hypothetical protein
MKVSWSKIGAIRRILEDFPFAVSQGFICLVGSMGTRVVMQEQQWWTKWRFGFPCQFSVHRLLHIHHHLSSGAGTTGQIVDDVPSGLSLTPPQ